MHDLYSDENPKLFFRKNRDSSLTPHDDDANSSVYPRKDEESTNCNHLHTVRRKNDE